MTGVDRHTLIDLLGKVDEDRHDITSAAWNWRHDVSRGSCGAGISVTAADRIGPAGF
jgi:hypothetical protein